MATEEAPAATESQTPKEAFNSKEALTSGKAPAPEEAPDPEDSPASEEKPAPEEKSAANEQPASEEKSAPEEERSPETPAPETPTPETPTPEALASEIPPIEETPTLALTKYLNLPDEIMLKILNRIPDYHWPEAWSIVRRISRTWKFEAELLFQQRYLSSMTIIVSNCEFYFDTEKEEGKQAFFKSKQRDIADGEWQLITRRLALGYSTGNSYMYMISFPKLGVINDTAFVDLIVNSETRSFSFQWVPTVSKLFREETKIRKTIRARVE
ncbi:hypothetical protein O1611_g1190 [Lasiodiplodia mahajangana]|uniref:Uncharacterized protein n=1 Tax=Lasiodiplodia mahajangana TaxID=1108764 RepID=A0ACC2JY61_9PEZI|nr:hypothetical protein O1611_g1190 [Lasiodiplodia mahajangana]